MGIIGKIIELTPFLNSYKKYRQSKIEQYQQEFEAKHLPLRIDFYKKLINPNDLVFDIGANIGNRVESFLKCGARVVAIEPQPDCVNILKENLSEEYWNTKVNEGIGEIFKLTVSLGGTLSGEHGIGIAKRPYMSIAMSEVNLNLMRGIKKVFDPNGILNPGKIF